MNPIRSRLGRSILASASLVTTSLALTATSGAQAQILPGPALGTGVLDLPDAAPSFDLCATSSVRLNTGLDHSTIWSASNSTIQPGALHNPVPDEGWMLVRDPFPWSHEPRPARVIQRHSSWPAPFGRASQWIGSRDTAIDDPSYGSLDYFVFRTRFCARAASPVLLNLLGQASGELEFFPNPPSLGALLVPGVPSGLAPYHLPGTVTGSTTSVNTLLWSVRSGENHLYARVRRTSGVAVGLNVDATLTSIVGATLRHPSCCLSNSIIGRKLNDHQPDYTNENNRQFPMNGVPIAAIRTSPALPPVFKVTLSDWRGDFAFVDLPHGTYRVEEPTYFPCVRTVPFFPGFYTIEFDPFFSQSGPRAVTLNDLSDATLADGGPGPGEQGFGNWCDTCAGINNIGSDAGVLLDCAHWASQTQTGTDPFLALSYFNERNCTVNRVKIDVLYPSSVVVTPSVFDIAATPQYAAATFPTIGVDIPATHAHEAVCLRFSFYSVSGGVETLCCREDVCVWATCVTYASEPSIGGGGE